MTQPDPTDAVAQARDALEQEIYDEMSGGPPDRVTRWPAMLDALIAAVRAECADKVAELEYLLAEGRKRAATATETLWQERGVDAESK